MRLVFEIPHTSPLTWLVGKCTSKTRVQQTGLSRRFSAYKWYLNPWMRSQGSKGIEEKSFKIRTETWGFSVVGGHVGIVKPAK